MNLIKDDLKAINIQFLMLAREHARHNPLHAIWEFNLTEGEIGQISSLSIDEINKLAECGRVIFKPPLIGEMDEITPAMAAALKVITSDGSNK